jgi:hypothetical protein
MLRNKSSSGLREAFQMRHGSSTMSQVIGATSNIASIVTSAKAEFIERSKRYMIELTAIEQGRDVNCSLIIDFLKFETSHDKTSYHRSFLESCIIGKNVSILTQVLDAVPNFCVEIEDEHGHTPVDIAINKAMGGFVDVMLRYIIFTAENVTEKLIDTYRTRLLSAVYVQNITVLAALLKKISSLGDFANIQIFTEDIMHLVKKSRTISSLPELINVSSWRESQTAAGAGAGSVVLDYVELEVEGLEILPRDSFITRMIIHFARLDSVKYLAPDEREIQAINLIKDRKFSEFQACIKYFNPYFRGEDGCIIEKLYSWMIEEENSTKKQYLSDVFKSWIDSQKNLYYLRNLSVYTLRSSEFYNGQFLDIVNTRIIHDFEERFNSIGLSLQNAIDRGYESSFIDKEAEKLRSLETQLVHFGLTLLDYRFIDLVKRYSDLEYFPYPSKEDPTNIPMLQILEQHPKHLKSRAERFNDYLYSQLVCNFSNIGDSKSLFTQTISKADFPLISSLIDLMHAVTEEFPKFLNFSDIAEHFKLVIKNAEEFIGEAYISPEYKEQTSKVVFLTASKQKLHEALIALSHHRYIYAGDEREKLALKVYTDIKNTLIFIDIFSAILSPRLLFLLSENDILSNDEKREVVRRIYFDPCPLQWIRDLLITDARLLHSAVLIKQNDITDILIDNGMILNASEFGNLINQSKFDAIKYILQKNALTSDALELMKGKKGLKFFVDYDFKANRDLNDKEQIYLKLLNRVFADSLEPLKRYLVSVSIDPLDWCMKSHNYIIASFFLENMNIQLNRVKINGYLGKLEAISSLFQEGISKAMDTKIVSEQGERVRILILDNKKKLINKLISALKAKLQIIDSAVQPDIDKALEFIEGGAAVKMKGGAGTGASTSPKKKSGAGTGASISPKKKSGIEVSAVVSPANNDLVSASEPTSASSSEARDEEISVSKEHMEVGSSSFSFEEDSIEHLENSLTNESSWRVIESTAKRNEGGAVVKGAVVAPQTSIDHRDKKPVKSRNVVSPPFKSDRMKRNEGLAVVNEVAAVGSQTSAAPKGHIKVAPSQLSTKKTGFSSMNSGNAPVNFGSDKTARKQRSYADILSGVVVEAKASSNVLAQAVSVAEENNVQAKEEPGASLVAAAVVVEAKASSNVLAQAVSVAEENNVQAKEESGASLVAAGGIVEASEKLAKDVVSSAKRVEEIAVKKNVNSHTIPTAKIHGSAFVELVSRREIDSRGGISSFTQQSNIARERIKEVYYKRLYDSRKSTYNYYIYDGDLGVWDIDQALQYILPSSEGKIDNDYKYVHYIDKNIHRFYEHVINSEWLEIGRPIRFLDLPHEFFYPVAQIYSAYWPRELMEKYQIIFKMIDVSLLRAEFQGLFNAFNLSLYNKGLQEKLDQVIMCCLDKSKKENLLSIFREVGIPLSESFIADTIGPLSANWLENLDIRSPVARVLPFILTANNMDLSLEVLLKKEFGVGKDRICLREHEFLRFGLTKRSLEFMVADEIGKDTACYRLLNEYMETNMEKTWVSRVDNERVVAQMSTDRSASYYP